MVSAGQVVTFLKPMDKTLDLTMNCPVSATLEVIGGKWRMMILWSIDLGYNRFGLMQRVMPGISKKQLTAELRELERQGLISRTVFAEVPPRVEYAITPLGESLRPVLIAIRDWGRENGGRLVGALTVA
jgi:DNA-binding HxlR family transcriptional regulator